VVGRQIPASLALLAVAFLLCALVVAGMPPLSGFVGKLAMLHAIAGSGASLPPLPAWLLFALLVVSSLTGGIALLRAFSAHFWAASARGPVSLRLAEALPVAFLLAGCVGIAAAGDRVLAFTGDVAASLHAPGRYVDTVFQARPVPAPAGVTP